MAVATLNKWAGFNPTRVSTATLRILGFSVIVLAGSVVASFWISINLMEYSKLINTSGKIRGGIQRVSKLCLARAPYSTQVAEVDSAFLALNSFLGPGRTSHLAGLHISNRAPELFNAWKDYKSSMEAGSLSRDDLLRKSGYLWVLASEVVESVEDQARGFIEVLYLISLGSIFVIAALVGSILIVKFAIQGKLEFQASYDHLTGLLNRNQLEYLCRRKVREGYADGDGLAFLLCDIDHFKSINDAFGHDVGDNVLVRVAEGLRNNARSADPLFRYGGEEFLLLTAYNSIPGLMRYAERLRQAIESQAYATRPVTVSIGIGLGGGGKSMQDVIAQADSALYTAKEAGRNRVELSSP